MKELLKKVFPLVDFYFADKGVSATTANSKKNDNTNENANLMKNLQDAPLYMTEISLLTERGVTTHEMNVRKLTPQNFDVLSTVAKNNGESAILGNGIKLFNTALETIRGFDATKLVTLNGGDVSLPEHLAMPIRQFAVKGNLDNVLQYERVEDILAACNESVLVLLDADMVKKGLFLESEVAVFGKELTKDSSFLQRVIFAQRSLTPKEAMGKFGLSIREEKLAYTEGEVDAFITLFNNLQTHYHNIQGQLNGTKKTIKDTIRMVDVAFAKEYDAELKAYQSRESEIREKQNLIAAQGETLRQQLVQEFLALKIQVG